MSKRFMIKSMRPEEEKIGGNIKFGSGEQVPFKHSLVLHGRGVGETPKGDTILEYVTGLEETNIDYNIFFPKDEDKVALKKLQKEDRELLSKVYSKDELKPTNEFFWVKNGKGSFSVTNETLSTFFDTKNPEHALLYWKIVGGGYSDAIAPTYEHASQFALPFYLTEMEEEAERRSEDIGIKGKAYAALEDLSEKKSTEDMLWIAWSLPDVTQGFTMRTPKATLYTVLFEYIEGKLVKKAKKSCAKQFLEVYNLIKKDKTRAIAIAVIRAAEYFSLIFTNKEGQLELRSERKVLGASVEAAIETLLKPTNIESLEGLREDVDAKLK